LTTINSFYEVVSKAIKPEIQDTPAPSALPAHWIVVLDEQGVAATRIDEVVESQVLAALIDNGAQGAAFVTQAIDSRETIMADVLVATPRNSDVRRAYVRRTDSGAELGHWEHLV
jgi:hypothetical protein